MKKQEKWTRLRHRVVRTVAYPALALYCQWKYGITIEKFKAQKRNPYLILYNHQTPFDQFFVGLAFKEPVYYLASEDIFSNGWISSLIRFLVAPIPIKKQTTDILALKTCFQVAREGGTIAIAPEGNRTYSGKTEFMRPSIAALARKLKNPIALFRIEGGYGVQPRWSDGVRKGKMRAYVSQVISPEEYAELTDAELFSKIASGLQVNEGVVDGTYISSKRAEFLERAVYVCPYCGLSAFESHGNEVSCKKCGRIVRYGVDKTLEGVGYHFPFRFMTEWYDYQNAFVHSLDLTAYRDIPLFRDISALYEVIIRKKKHLLRKAAALALYGDRIVVDEGTDHALVLPFAKIDALAVLGRNKANIYCGKTVYQLKSDKRFNALKYVNIYYRYKNMNGGSGDGKFLGL